MAQEPAIECAFFVPIHRDKNLSDGELHSTKAWRWLEDELDFECGAFTLAPGLYQGCYRDPDTKERVDDESRRYIVAIPNSAVGRLRALLARVCVKFQQKCIYLSVGSQVEFIEGVDHGPNGSLH
jgi:hypothetical protein